MKVVGRWILVKPRRPTSARPTIDRVDDRPGSACMNRHAQPADSRWYPVKHHRRLIVSGSNLGLASEIAGGEWLSSFDSKSLAMKTLAEPVTPEWHPPLAAGLAVSSANRKAFDTCRRFYENRGIQLRAPSALRPGSRA